MSPVKCPSCRDRTIRTVLENHSTTLEHDGRPYEVEVASLPVLLCSRCGYRTLDREANAMLGLALRDAAGLMHPDNIRECREELGLSQKVLADHLGIAPATLCRWETGAQIQQRGYDDKLRLYFKFPLVRRELATRMGVSGGKVVVGYGESSEPNAPELEVSPAASGGFERTPISERHVAATRPPIVKLADLAPGESGTFFAQLAAKARSSTNAGKPYFACKFRDRARSVSAVPIWSDAPLFEPCSKWIVGQFFKLRGAFTVHEKFGPQLDVAEIRPVEDRDREDGFTELDFVDRSRFEPDAMLDELQALALTEIRDEPIRALVVKLLTDHAEMLKWLPATATKFYPFAGGWLEHTLSVAKNCAWLADRYIERWPEMIPPLNRDLVVAAAVLHDIGRVKEYAGSPPGSVPRPGVEGELFGHVLLGRDLVRDAAREIPNLHPELSPLLEHLIYTHLTRPEWGSPRLPCIPEALILHHADDLDAKFEMYARCLRKDTSDGPFTDRDPVLNRPLLKRREV